MTSLTDVQVVNRSLQQIGSQSQITSFADPTPEAQAATTLYSGIVQSVIRQAPWDFCRKVLTLTTSGNTAPAPWTQEYLYPTDCVQMRQVMPPSPNKYDPQPVLWAVGSAVVTAVPTKVIWANQASAVLVYSYNAPESEWDSLFTETTVRSLASAFAMSIDGRPDYGKEKLEEAGMLTNIAESRDY